MRKRKPSTLTSNFPTTVYSVGTEKFTAFIQPVKDKFLSTTIKVTKEDIDYGRGYQTDGEKCPLARAISRTFKASDVSVSTRTVLLNNRHFALPTKAQEFVSNFDLNESVKPFSFKLVTF